jgi:hypothetical protein
LPAPLEELLAQVDAVEREARSLVEALDEAQLNWQPEGGRRWSVGQCLDHLARINTFYIDTVMPAVHDAARSGAGSFNGLHPTWLGRRFVASLEPPVARKLKVPLASLAPPSRVRRDGILNDLVTGHQPYRELVALSAGLDTDRVRVRNPFYNRVRMRLSTVLLVIPAHDRRHMWQARNVLTELRKSGAGRPDTRPAVQGSE